MRICYRISEGQDFAAYSETSSELSSYEIECILWGASMVSNSKFQGTCSLDAEIRNKQKKNDVEFQARQWHIWYHPSPSSHAWWTLTYLLNLCSNVSCLTENCHDSLTVSCEVRCSSLWDLFPYFFIAALRFYITVGFAVVHLYTHTVWQYNLANIISHYCPFPSFLLIEILPVSFFWFRSSMFPFFSQFPFCTQIHVPTAQFASSCLFCPLGFGSPLGQGQDFLVCVFSWGLSFSPVNELFRVQVRMIWA